MLKSTKLPAKPRIPPKSKSKLLVIRVTNEELKKLKGVCLINDVTMSDAIRGILDQILQENRAA